MRTQEIDLLYSHGFNRPEKPQFPSFPGGVTVILHTKMAQRPIQYCVSLWQRAKCFHVVGDFISLHNKPNHKRITTQSITLEKANESQLLLCLFLCTHCEIQFLYKQHKAWMVPLKGCDDEYFKCVCVMARLQPMSKEHLSCWSYWAQWFQSANSDGAVLLLLLVSELSIPY